MAIIGSDKLLRCDGLSGGARPQKAAEQPKVSPAEKENAADGAPNVLLAQEGSLSRGLVFDFLRSAWRPSPRYQPLGSPAFAPLA